MNETRKSTHVSNEGDGGGNNLCAHLKAARIRATEEANCRLGAQRRAEELRLVGGGSLSWLVRGAPISRLLGQEVDLSQGAVGLLPLLREQWPRGTKA